ncbi:MAG TPA: LptF/LptG family permease [Puia sp.]|nr:LptF/LptG family permease [Puia sp.]
MLTPLIKKLDKLIVKAFIGPFIAIFFITTFVLVLQFFWLYIDDVVGKGVDLGTIGRLILYVSATLVPLALPLAVLLASIMTFGNLGETFELVAIKSAGITLLRFMRPLFIVSIIICYIAFLFNNYIIPVANLKMNTLKYDIIMSKPAFDIKEGVFYDRIEGYVIKIGKKEKDDSTIRDVVIYEQNFSGLQDDIIIAEKGKMIVTPDKKSLEFKLQNGSLYREKGERLSTNTEFVRMGFKEYEKVLDLSSFKLNRTDDSNFRNNYQMLSLRQLGNTIDSLKRTDSSYLVKVRTEIKGMLNFPKYLDTTGWNELPPPPPLPTPTATSTTPAAASTTTTGGTTATNTGKKAAEPQKPITFRDLMPDSARSAVLDRSISVLNGVKGSLDQPSMLFETERNDLRNHQIAWHEKLTLSVACLVMFLIGAPLGSIIRKGGIGLPLVFAVIFFVVFFLLNNFGKKFVKQDVLTPISGMWLATYVLTPVGLFLIYKALHDSQLFNKEFYFRVIKNIRPLLQRARRKMKHE